MADSVDPSHDPRTNFHTVLADAVEHPDMQALHSEISSDRPDPKRIQVLVERLQQEPELQLRITTWWNSPQTQSFLAELNAMGL